MADDLSHYHGGAIPKNQQRRRRANRLDDEEDDASTNRQRRRPSQPPPYRPRSSPPPYCPRSSPPPYRPPSSPPHRPRSPPTTPTVMDGAAACPETKAERDKRQLEWELSTLKASDLRSHAWYHGNRVNRITAQYLLRQHVAEERRRMAAESGAAAAGLSESDELLDDVSTESSDGDYARDGEERPRGEPPSQSVLSPRDVMMTAARPNPRRRPRRHRYCFLVRDSENVRPPGRYVVSCLRMDTWTDEDGGGGDRETRAERLRRKLRQTESKHQRYPVLHFVINRIITSRGSVYQQPQFTFGNSIPIPATVTSVTINQKPKNPPAFDSVPDLIRYYVGGTDETAVLTYSGDPPLLAPGSEVRLRYPCNRSSPLTRPDEFLADYASDFPYIPQIDGLSRRASSPPPNNNNYTNYSPGRPRNRIIPDSGTASSATATSRWMHSSAAGSATSSTTLPRSSSFSRGDFPRSSTSAGSAQCRSTLPRSLTSTSSSHPQLFAGPSTSYNSDSFPVTPNWSTLTTTTGHPLLLNRDPFVASVVPSDRDERPGTTSSSWSPGDSSALARSLDTATAHLAAVADMLSAVTASSSSTLGQHDGAGDEPCGIDIDAEIVASLYPFLDYCSVDVLNDLRSEGVRSSFSCDSDHASRTPMLKTEHDRNREGAKCLTTTPRIEETIDEIDKLFETNDGGPSISPSLNNNMVRNWFGIHQPRRTDTDVQQPMDLTEFSGVASDVIESQSKSNAPGEETVGRPPKGETDENVSNGEEDSNDNGSKSDSGNTTGVDYENAANAQATDYENVRSCAEKKRESIENDSGGRDNVAASALQAIHVAIIGDHENVDSTASVAGTGRLAAALCHADGKTTIVPYDEQSKTEEEQSDAVPLEDCPLQVLGQPGPEGRRARLDVIERSPGRIGDIKFVDKETEC